MKSAIFFDLCSIGVFLAAAFAVFLILLNRLLILFQDSTFKKYLILITFSGLMGGAGVLGYVLGYSTWLILPILVLIGIFIGEIRQLALRRRFRGAAPITPPNKKRSLTQPVTTTDLQILHYEVPYPSLDGAEFTIVHLSDFHVTDAFPFEYYLDVMAQVNRIQPDFIFITGDFITRPEFIAGLPEILQLAQSRLGTFAVLGNHDYWADPEKVAAAVRSAGIVLLEDEPQRIRINDKKDVIICGYDAPWREAEWQMPATNAGDIVLALTHTADNIYELSRTGVQAVFSGHYHAGQIRLPWLGAVVVPSKYGRRFDQGHFVVDQTHLFVTAGVGAAMPAFRIYCPPDIFVVKFVGS